MTHLSDKFIKGDLLDLLGITDAGSDRQAVLDRLMAHLDQVIFETLVTNASDEQVERLSKANDESQEALIAEAESCAQKIPGLWDKLEAAVEGEMNTLRDWQKR